MERSRTPFSLIPETGALQRTYIPAGHAIVYIAQQMALIYNTILRAFNSSRNHCHAVKAGTSDANEFLFYNQRIYHMLHEHNVDQEEILFPAIEELAGVPGLMDLEIEQHKPFRAGVEWFRQYTYNRSMEDYDGFELEGLIRGSGSVMTKHLHDDIPSLFDLKGLDSAELMKIWKTGEDAARSRVDQSKDAPLVFGCQDNTFPLDGQVRWWPDSPAFVPYFIKYIFSRRYAGVWRFNPSDAFGRPKTSTLAW